VRAGRASGTKRRVLLLGEDVLALAPHHRIEGASMERGRRRVGQHSASARFLSLPASARPCAARLSACGAAPGSGASLLTPRRDTRDHDDLLLAAPFLLKLQGVNGQLTPARSRGKRRFWGGGVHRISQAKTGQLAGTGKLRQRFRHAPGQFGQIALGSPDGDAADFLTEFNGTG
jgi:hypothetical protein